MDEKIKQILQLAVHAPSGENCQPWRFETQGKQVDIYNIPSRDNSLYSWGQRASYIAHGALIENIHIAASTFGYVPKVNPFPDAHNPELVAHIIFDQTTPKEHPLYSYIKERATNRKPYRNTTLTTDQRAELDKVPMGIEKGKILFVEDAQKKKAIAEAAAGNERILFENPYMHKFFYDHITWTKKEDQEKKIGFYIKTFELPPPAERMFKLARKPGFVRIANKVGFSKMVAKQNAKVYASASAIGAVVMPRNSPEDFLLAGRLMQRAWLVATKLGLSIQPLTGILFLAQGIQKGFGEQFTPEQQIFVKTQYQQIKTALGMNQETIAMMFRIGNSELPTARSIRLSPEISIMNKTAHNL